MKGSGRIDAKSGASRHCCCSSRALNSLPSPANPFASARNHLVAMASHLLQVQLMAGISIALGLVAIILQVRDVGRRKRPPITIRNTSILIEASK